MVVLKFLGTVITVTDHFLTVTDHFLKAGFRHSFPSFAVPNIQMSSTLARKIDLYGVRVQLWCDLGVTADLYGV